MTPLLDKPKTAEGDTVETGAALFGADALLRLSAICVVFLILSLMANHEKSGKFAAAFGGLILAGLLVHTSPAIWSKAGSIFGGHVGSVPGTASAGSGTGGKISAAGNIINPLAQAEAGIASEANPFAQAEADKVGQVISWLKEHF
jgi:hypothetical protein